MNTTSALRARMKERLFPFITGKGYVLEENRTHTIKFRRRSGDTIQTLSIIWDKYNRARFAVDAHTLPFDSPLLRGEEFLISIEDPTVFKYKSARLTPGLTMLTVSWFRLDKPVFKRLLGGEPIYTTDFVIDQFIALYPEIEQWFLTGKRGNHMSVFTQEIRLKGKRNVDKAAIR